MQKIVWTFLLLFFGNYVFSQSCCSGGVPLSSNLGLPISAKNTWQFSFSYDLNVLNTLMDGSSRLEDNTRKRTTHSVMFQTGYTLSNKFSFDILIPYVRQERELTPKDLPGSFDATQGIGDMVFLTKYQFIRNYQVGIGLKFPTGSSVETNSLGLTLNADMQPGSGSWDVIYWFSGTQNLKMRPTMSFGLVASYRNSGENSAYFGNQIYDFGNEIQSTLTISDQLLIGSSLITPSLGFKYRNVNADQNDGTEVPSTGGSWLFLRPGIGYQISQKFNIQLTFDIPVFSDLQGTQLSPTFRSNIALLFTLSTLNIEP